MAVITGLQANIGDLDSFLGAWEGTSSRLASYGATESRCVQIMMAGELSGRFNIANQWNDIDAAMTGCADNVADSATQSAMSAAGVEMLGRTLSNLEHSVGDTSGKFGSYLMGTGDIPSADDFAEMTGRAWEHIGDAASGQTWTRRLVGPSGVGDWAVATYTDSLNDLMAASAALFANADQMALMNKTNSAMTGRAFFQKVA